MKILFIGEINPDLILQGFDSFPALGHEVLVKDSSLVIGSASAICATAAAKLGNEVAFFGKTGCDAWGDFCLERLRSSGVDIAPVIRDASLKTGITVSISSPTDRALVTHLGAIAALTERDVSDNLLQGYQHLHVSSYFMQEGLRPGVARLFERATRIGLTCSLDPGCDPTCKWDDGVRDAIRQTDIFFPNEVELAGITGLADPEGALRSLTHPRTLTVAKLGAAGCMAIVDGQTTTVPPFPVQPTDTTGAGDSFNAAFLHFWLRRRPLEDALQFAAVYGALATLGTGGTGNQVSYREAEAVWRQYFRKQAKPSRGA